jgi:predicted short-subunit dehydrogenase-like oxidoreductase (DUF2520 family)
LGIESGNRMTKPSVSIIGYGRLGQHLLRWLLKAGYPIAGVFNRSTMPMNPEMFQATYMSEFPESPDQLGDLTILSVSDAAIPAMVSRLYGMDLNGKCIVHTSGAISSAVLADLRDRKAHIGSFHPLQTFGPVGKKNPFKECSISLEGDWKCIEHLLEMSRILGANPHQTDAKGKALLHLAAVWASNYMLVLLHAAQSVATTNQMSTAQVQKMIGPLVQQSIENAAEHGPLASLTGPASRGDIESVHRHLELMKSTPDLIDLYKALAKAAAHMSMDRGSITLGEYDQFVNSMVNGIEK